MSLINVGYV